MIGPYECYACGKVTRGTRPVMLAVVLVDDDGRRVPVGPDCLRHTLRAGAVGYVPRRGGPRLFYNEKWRQEFLGQQQDA